MQIYALCKGHPMPGPLERSKKTSSGTKTSFLAKTIRVMRLTAYLLLVCCLHVSAKVASQTITLNANNIPLNQVFSEIRKQTGYLVFYDLELITATRPVSVMVKDIPLEAFLTGVLKDRSLVYSIRDKNIIIREKEIIPVAPADLGEATGLVMTTDGTPLPGANVRVKGTANYVGTDANGKFTIKAKPGEILQITFIGYVSREVTVPPSGTNIRIAMEASVSALDEKIVQAYGITSKRLSTSNIDKVSGKVLNQTPSSNVLAALQGRVAGVVVTQATGVPGSGFKVEIRGRTQVDKYNSASNEPLFILDGIPLAANNANINLLQSAISAYTATGLSPINSINMADIESIEILKDADATAIYGSRGANGVVLITTRRGKAGATRFSLNYTTGGSRANVPHLLSTKDYVAMRNEAFANDNKVKTISNAYDLLVWDTTRDNHLAKQLIGGTATTSNAQASVSGGTDLVQYMASGGYYRETDVYPGKFPNTRGSGQLNINTRSANRKFNAAFRANYSSNKNTTSSRDLAGSMTMAPNYELYDSAGGLMWNEKGYQMDNPLAYMLQKYTATTENLMADALLSYQIVPGLSLRTSVGYNTIGVNELSLTPKTSQNPLTANLVGRAAFGNNNFKSWIVEPQAEYATTFGKSRLDILGGATYQSQRNTGYSFTVNGYTSDEFLGSMVGIPANAFISPASVFNEYKYQAFFGRVNYNYDDKYILNFSGRRDGSSRFGPNYRFSNFGAVGGAWLLSSEEFMKAIPVVSFAKLRASYGITGNDKIGDYKYLDAYSSYLLYPTYGNQTAFTPTALFKPDLHWEKNLKLEVALETGFLKDRILFSAAWYRNRSSDPLVQYPLPNTTGFSTITANLAGVLVQNSGFEFTFTSYNVRRKNFEWNTTFNLTVPKNKLVRFDGLAQTSYASSYVLGRSLNLVYIAKYAGIDPNTGLYTVEDLNKNGTFQVNASTAGGDLQPLFDTDPKYYGGLTNTFRYKRITLDFLMQFTKQMGGNWMSYMTAGFNTLPAGAIQNLPYIALDTWKKPGDNAAFQKLITANSGPSNSLSGWPAAFYSDLKYGDASYIRLKNVSLSYELPSVWLAKARISSLRVYGLAQNLFTWTPMKVVDPETIFLNRLPPLRTITFGIQLGF